VSRQFRARYVIEQLEQARSWNSPKEYVAALEELGDRADIVVIDPEKLDESLDAYAEHPVESYGGLSRMVNRNYDTVSSVLVSGQLVFGAGQVSPVLGKQGFGQFLRAGDPSRTLTPAVWRSVTQIPLWSRRFHLCIRPIRQLRPPK
jgi:hypothetical protein